jgi:hypothetical protein
MLPRAKNVNANRAAFSKPRISLQIRPIHGTVAERSPRQRLWAGRSVATGWCTKRIEPPSAPREILGGGRRSTRRSTHLRSGGTSGAEETRGAASGRLAQTPNFPARRSRRLGGSKLTHLSCWSAGPQPRRLCAQNSRICLRILPMACSWSWRIRSRDRLYLSPISFSVSSSSLSRPKRQRMMRDSIGVSVPSRR